MKFIAKKINSPKILFSTMGCRTANGADVCFDAIYKENLNKVCQDNITALDSMISAAQKDSRGNICPVTIILPTIAMEAKEIAIGHPLPIKTDKEYQSAKCDLWQAVVEHPEKIIDTFMELLDKKIYEAKDMLLERFEYICAQPAESAKFMYENGLMAGYDGKTTRSALMHGTLALGQLGLAECLQILIGKDHTTPEGMELAKRIEQLFKTRCAEFKEQYKLNFGVYYTPKISDWVSRK